MRELYPRYACRTGCDTPLMRESVPSVCVEIGSFPHEIEEVAMGTGFGYPRKTARNFGIQRLPYRFKLGAKGLFLNG